MREAVDSLKHMLVSTYRRYSAPGEDKLVPGPRRQLAVLRAIVS